MDEITGFLDNHLGLTQEDIDDLDFADASNIFALGYKTVTSIDKELKKTSV